MNTSRMLKKSAYTKKVEVQAKAEIKSVGSSLDRNLGLSLLHSLRPCWTNFLSTRCHTKLGSEEDLLRGLCRRQERMIGSGSSELGLVEGTP